MKYLLIWLLVLLPFGLTAQTETVFTGIPSKRIERTAESSRSSIITGLERQSSSVRITRQGDIFYWASQKNQKMRLVVEGVYLTYIAVDGSGYVRTLVESARQKYLDQSPENSVGQTMYVEHLLIGLESLTYYGR